MPKPAEKPPKKPKDRTYGAEVIPGLGGMTGQVTRLTNRQRQALRYGAFIIHLGLDRFTEAEFKRDGYPRSLFKKARAILLESGALEWVDQTNPRLSVRATPGGKAIAARIIRSPPL